MSKEEMDFVVSIYPFVALAVFILAAFLSGLSDAGKMYRAKEAEYGPFFTVLVVASLAWPLVGFILLVSILLTLVSFVGFVVYSVGIWLGENFRR